VSPAETAVCFLFWSFLSVFEFWSVLSVFECLKDVCVRVCVCVCVCVCVVLVSIVSSRDSSMVLHYDYY